MAQKAAKAKDELVFLPLGGCGEIGMNLNLYGFGPAHKRKWIIVDIGVRRMRVLSAPKRMTGLAGFGLEVVEYVESEHSADASDEESSI